MRFIIVLFCITITINAFAHRYSNQEERGVFFITPLTGETVSNPIKIAFGAKGGGGKLAVKIKDPKASKAFADRHNCDTANDKLSARYWSCRLPYYAKDLGLTGGGNFFW